MTTIIGWILMGSAAFLDARMKAIPVRLIGFAAGVSAMASIVLVKNGLHTPQELAASLMPGAALLLVALVTHEAVGYGDGLLLLVAGPLFGWQKMLLCIPAALLLTSAVSVFLLAFKKADRKTKILFIPFLAAGMGVISLAF